MNPEAQVSIWLYKEYDDTADIEQVRKIDGVHQSPSFYETQHIFVCASKVDSFDDLERYLKV